LAKRTNFEISSLGLAFQVSTLGVFDEVWVSKVTVSTTSLPGGTWTMVTISRFHQRWPESLFQTPTPLLIQNFWIRIRVRQYFKFENPTPVQPPATIIDPTGNYPSFYLTNDHTDSCYCRKGKVTPGQGPFFHKFLIPDPGPNEKRRILPESTPVIQIRCRLWF